MTTRPRRDHLRGRGRLPLTRHRVELLEDLDALSEVEALLHHRHLETAKRAAIEDEWLLRRFREHSLTMDELARRMCRSKSWVSRRLGLLDALATSAQEAVRTGSVPSHAAMKYLVPLARANKRQCEQLVAGLKI
jgi:hypothetical protein